jgi:ribonuclease D
MFYSENISAEEIEVLEIANFDGPIIVVSEMDVDFVEAINYLSKQEVIGFDTETKPCFQSHSPRNNVALLQLSGEDRAFLFRLHSLGLPKPLTSILSNAKIIKVGAAVKDDIRGLLSYRRFVPKGFVDLQSIVEQYGIKEKSVKKMSAIVMGLKVSKSQQLSNWEAPQLSGAQLKYAAIDAWICREIYLKLHSSPVIE